MLNRSTNAFYHLNYFHKVDFSLTVTFNSKVGQLTLWYAMRPKEFFSFVDYGILRVSSDNDLMRYGCRIIFVKTNAIVLHVSSLFLYLPNKKC